jgi:hypothetical protein
MLIMRQLSDGLFIQDEDQTHDSRRLTLRDGCFWGRRRADMDADFDPDNPAYPNDDSDAPSIDDECDEFRDDEPFACEEDA